MPLDRGAHDPTKPRYTPWRKTFAWVPKKLINGNKAWLKFIYVRSVIIEWMPPSFPAEKYIKQQYADVNHVIKDTFNQKNW